MFDFGICDVAITNASHLWFVRLRGISEYDYLYSQEDHTFLDLLRTATNSVEIPWESVKQ